MQIKIRGQGGPRLSIDQVSYKVEPSHSLGKFC